MIMVCVIESVYSLLIRNQIVQSFSLYRRIQASFISCYNIAGLSKELKYVNLKNTKVRNLTLINIEKPGNFLYAILRYSKIYSHTT